MKNLLSTLRSHATRRLHWFRKYRAEISILISGLIAMNLIFIADTFRATGTVNGASAGQLGDFVGGYIGTFFALTSVILLLITLKNQRQSSAMLAFEGKYFEMVKMHRENVFEMELQNLKGRRIFIMLFRELREAYAITRRVNKDGNHQINEQQCWLIAFNCLFFGVGSNSSRMLKASLSKYPSEFFTALELELSTPKVREDARIKWNLGYEPFDGHQSRLGHYYRHLYQSVRYVDQQAIEIDKYDYIKTIRAQLTTYEQALLFVNSLTPLGQDWWQKGFIKKYRMVQNIPKDFFDPQDEVDLTKYFESGYFEWEDAEQIPAGSMDRS